MNVSPQIKVLHVTFGEGRLSVNVQQQFIVEDGTAVNAGPIEQIGVNEEDAIASATKAGRSDWGNADVETVIRSAQKLARPAIPAIPEVPAVPDGTGGIAREAVPGRDEMPAVYTPRFDPTAKIVW